MSVSPALLALAAILLAAAALVWFFRWGARWGATDEEVAVPITGEDWLAAGPRQRVRMTRAVTIDAPAAEVWPWIAQLGRGAGWYSYDRLDNAGLESARHLVSWIPAPALGDASPIGYVRHLEPGGEITWFTPPAPTLGARVRAIFSFRAESSGDRTRVVGRCLWDGEGLTAWLALGFFQIVDTVMMRRQLLNLKQRVEAGPDAARKSARRETGARDQYQSYHVIYASGEEAGIPGKEKAAEWRRVAIRDGVLPGP